jgi:hypothetical protein
MDIGQEDNIVELDLQSLSRRSDQLRNNWLRVLRQHGILAALREVFSSRGIGIDPRKRSARAASRKPFGDLGGAIVHPEAELL